MKLYHNPLSPNCRRALIVARHLGLAIDEKVVDFAKNEHKSPEFLAINPNGMIPALVDGDFTLWESRAIAQYFAAKKPEAGLLGQGERGRADVTRWLAWDAAHLTRHVGTILFEILVKRLRNMGPPNKAAISAAMEQVRRFLGVLDTCLKGKTYLVGDRLTIADLVVAASLTYADDLKLPLGEFPNVKAWLSRMTALEAWKSTQPQM